MSAYRPRLLDAAIGELFRELPALLLVEPRAAGKTTTAARHARSIVNLDREAEAAAFRADPDAALRAFEEPILLDEWLGRLLDTFVVSQLRAELVVTAAHPRLYHLRQQEGRLEVDIVAELGGGRLIGIEVKANAAPTAEDAKHLLTLREHLDQEFVAGVVLHTGPRVYELGDRVVAAPISSLWAG